MIINIPARSFVNLISALVLLLLLLNLPRPQDSPEVGLIVHNRSPELFIKRLVGGSLLESEGCNVQEVSSTALYVAMFLQVLDNPIEAGGAENSSRASVFQSRCHIHPSFYPCSSTLCLA